MWHFHGKSLLLYLKNDFNLHVINEIKKKQNKCKSYFFYSNYSEIFATTSKNDIRVWKLITQKELLRISVPNFICSSICFNCNGNSIISGKLHYIHII